MWLTIAVIFCVYTVWAFTCYAPWETKGFSGYINGKLSKEDQYVVTVIKTISIVGVLIFGLIWLVWSQGV
jgi:hypothetical protein